MPVCGTKSVAARKAPRNGLKCIAHGIKWAAAAPARCSTAISRRLEQRVDHLRQLRGLQDETGGFTGFVPFAFEPQTTVLSHIKPASAFDQLRNLAVSRIYLDNVDHLTAYWVSMGLPLAQISLNYGVDDLHGTIIEEKIFHMAGATTPQQQTAAALEHAIREAGREPVQRDSHYRHITPNAGLKRTQAAPEAELACA